MRLRSASFIAAAITLTLVSACSDSTTVGSGTGGTTTTAAEETTTSVAGDTTTTAAAGTTDAPTTLAPATTAPPATAAPTAPPTTAGGGGGGCPGAGGIAPGADIGTVLHGDIDGDLADDTVTEYSLNGVPHVHAFLATGGHSDAEVQIGFGDHVSIKFTDFDHSLGAPTPPPVAVMAIGGAAAGTAYFSILTLTPQYCIRPWHIGGSMFVGHISQAGPFEGLWCDGAAGHIYYSLTSIEDAGGGNWDVTTRLMHHNFTTLSLDPADSFTVSMSEADMLDLYANLNPC